MTTSSADYSPTKLLLASDMIVFAINDNDLKTVLIRRKYEPYKDMWALPGGFVEQDEDLEEAARRELAEETGLTELTYVEQLYTFGKPGRDPRQRVVSIVYFSIVTGEVELRAGDDAGEVQWYSMYDLPSLSFDHDEILVYALQRLRYKIEYSDAVFYLLPEQFTLSELQRAYELVLDEKLDKRNFRRKILNARILKDTGEKRVGEGRPAHLYALKEGVKPEIKARRLFP